MTDWRTAARPGAALVTVLATEGSAPRGAGARMVVTEDRAVGTIGGGALELHATEQARAILSHALGTWRIQDYPLGPLLGQCCGGRVRLLIEGLADVDWIAALDGGVITTLDDSHILRVPAQTGTQSRARIVPLPWAPACAGAHTVVARGPLPCTGFSFVEPDDGARRPLTLFGAGHVGSAIAAKLVGLPFDLAWFDSRPEFDTSGLVIATEDELVACAAETSADAAVLILTHDHALDYRLTAAALASPASFVGLIGSRTKRARFLSRLAADGIDAGRLVSPIGMPGIPGKEPATIAVAVLAQLLALPV